MVDYGLGIAVFNYHYACVMCPKCGSEDVLWKTRQHPYIFRCLDCGYHAVWIESKKKWI